LKALLRCFITLGAFVLWFAPSAFAQGGPATPFSAAGTSAEQPPGRGPCALAVAGAGDAKDTANHYGVGSLTASGPGANPVLGASVCGGVGSIEFFVTAVTSSGNTLTLTVLVTESEAGSAAASGTTGTITILDDTPATGFSNDKITFAIGGFSATLGPDNSNAPAAASGTWADVKIGATIANATALTPFAATATSVFTQPGAEDALGPCTVALAGVLTAVEGPPVPEQSGGSFQALPGSAAPGPFCGTSGGGDAGQATYDGSTAAIVRDGYTPPPGTSGNVSYGATPDAENVAFTFGGWSGQFGPDRVANGTVDSRAEAVTATLAPNVITPPPPPPPTNTPCRVHGEGELISPPKGRHYSLEAEFKQGKTPDRDKASGHVMYRSSSDKVHFDAKTITVVDCSSDGSATITGSGYFDQDKTVKNQLVNFRIDVTDNGKRNGDDTFTINLDNGYSDTGTLKHGDNKIEPKPAKG
jgi:hypothetical protein